MLNLYQYGGLVIAIFFILAFTCMILLTIIITINRKYFTLRKEHKYEKALSAKEIVDKHTLFDSYEIIAIALNDLIHTKNETELNYKITMLRSIYTILELNPAKASELKKHIITYGKYGTDLKSTISYAIEKNLSIFPDDTKTSLERFYGFLENIDPIRERRAEEAVEAKAKVQQDAIHKKIKKDAPMQVQGATLNESIFETDADCVSIDYSDKTKSYLDQVEKETTAGLADYVKRTD